MACARPEVEASAGLELEPRIVVSLDLGAQGALQAAGNELDRVLHESVEKVVRPVRRDESERRHGGGPTVGDAVPESGHDLLPAREHEPVQGVQVERVAVFAEAGLTAVRPVIVRLDGDIPPPGESAIPTRPEVPARQIGILLHCLGVRRAERREGRSPARSPGVDVALDSESVGGPGGPIRAEPALIGVPIVVAAGARAVFSRAVEIHAVEAVDVPVTPPTAATGAAEA